MAGQRILLVEDQSLISNQLSKYLNANEYDVVDVCDNGNAAINVAKEQNPDLILMDIELKGKIDGIETAEIIKSSNDIPIIYLTSRDDKKTLNRAKHTEPAGFVTKNISQKELVIQIELALYKHEMMKERKRIQAMLEDSREKFKAIFNSAPDAIFFVNIDCEVSLWNRAAEKIFHINENKAYGKYIYNLIIEEESRQEFKQSFDIWKYTKDESQYTKTFEIMARRADEVVFPIEMTLTILEHNGQRAICGFARDIRIKYETEEEISKLIEEMQISKEIIEQNANELIVLNSKLSESEEQLIELNASKDRFFSIIAHDLKGPFQSLLGYSELLSRDIEHLDKEDITDFANSLHESASHLFKLLENLLQWSRLQRGVIEHNPENFQLSLMVNQNIELAQMRAAEKKITLENNVDDDIFFYADVNMVNTILRNLLSNSIKFTPEDGKIGVNAETRDEMIDIKVWDTGIGMDEEAKEKIFRIDQNHTTLGTNNEQGTGLGLILCKELTEKNKGEIVVESAPGEGTTFIISLPLGESEY